MKRFWISILVQLALVILLALALAKTTLSGLNLLIATSPVEHARAPRLFFCAWASGIG
jgi:hypothetical protein